MTRPPLKEGASAARRRLRDNARHNGLEYAMVRTFGMSVDQKIAFYSAPQENGCVLWTGAKGTPVLRFRGKCHSVRVLLWEKREERVLPEGWVVTTLCNEGRCIAVQCLKGLPRGEHLHSKENQQKSDTVRRLKYGLDRERYLTEALEHVKSVRGQLVRRFGPRLDVEDVLQEALLRVYLAWARDRKQVQDVKAFFAQLAMNRACDLLRVGGRIQYCDPQDFVLVGAPAPDMVDPAVIYERSLTAHRSSKRANAHMRKVSPRAREALRLQLQEDLSQKEIAARMGVSENTVEQHLTKARKLVAPRKTTGWRNAL